jgi:hypothetical protein
MKPDISEFSYGYALTDELIHWHGTSLTAAPVFPSLYQEGQTGGGYDVMLQRPGLPLFLQFKLSDCMIRSSAQEVQDGLFNVPYYRMHIRPARHSEQHEMLLDLESRGNEVYYLAPAFHTPEELNDSYLTHQVRARSLWLRPSIIGPLPMTNMLHSRFLAFTISAPGPDLWTLRAISPNSHATSRALIGRRAKQLSQKIRSSDLQMTFASLRKSDLTFHRNPRG